MMGGIIGDIVGSIYEAHNFKSKDFELFTSRNYFTDDSVLTAATASALMSDRDFARHYREFAKIYPHKGYGGLFLQWLGRANPEPYWSFGNGAAMRVGPVAHLAESEAECLQIATASASATHNHPEGLVGAQAVALGIFLARNRASLSQIQSTIEQKYNYSFRLTVDEIRIINRFDATASGSVPYALSCVFEANSFEDAIRNAVSIGGDTDTIACIAGSLAEAVFGIPAHIEMTALQYLNDHLRGVLADWRNFLSARRL